MGIGRIGEAIITVKSTLVLLIEEKLHRDRNGLQPSKLESCNFLPGNILEYSTEKTGSRSQRIPRKWIFPSVLNRDSYLHGGLFNLSCMFPTLSRIKYLVQYLFRGYSHNYDNNLRVYDSNI